MKKNNEVTRTCIVCRQKKDKKEFVRIVKNNENMICVDKTGKMNGRGCYVCAEGECVKNLKKVRALNKTYKTNFGEDVYDKIISELQ